MPEEKKEKFTFSDKIKNSKPVNRKSFVKSSSKIGRDGKPKATLFERTRRDAPFFIAALVALLLLPFLYKYSGQASEEQLLTLDNEQTEFDPERYGFDTAMIEDPDGQIAQLAGRDSLSLIKGWGGNQEEDYGRDDMDLDVSSSYEGEAEGKYAAERHSSTDMDVEENTTNIYKRRAGAATRAAFRRTKIGTLSPAGLRRPGGSRLGINNWGGGMKGAAKKVGPSTPASAPKPVSLQPLRAAGSRSTFGRGGAAAARKSKDNMGKANPIEALRDSYVKPVDPARVGGLDMFSMGPGGGSGKLGRNVNITPGKEPWWWDMMKTRMQKEWEARFNRKWDWIKFLDKFLQNILGQVANCLITGSSKGDVDNMFGNFGENVTIETTCCGRKESQWVGFAGPGIPFEKNSCKGFAKSHPDLCSEDWSAPSGGKNMGAIKQRLCCFGICNGNAYVSGDTELKSASGLACADMPQLYQVTPSGEARKWKTYIYVTARNYFPETLKGKFPMSDQMPKKGNLLCAQADRNHGGDSLNMTGKTSVSGGHGEEATGSKNAAAEHINKQNATTAKNIPSEEEEIRSEIYELDPESVQNGCVIYVQQGDTFDYEVFKNKMIDQFKQWGGGQKISEKDARAAFYELDLLSVESFAAKDKLAYTAIGGSGHELKGMLPMLYWRFYDAYVRHKKITHKKDGSKDNVHKAKYRVENLDVVYGPICHFDTALTVDCEDDTEIPQATVTFKRGYQGLSGKSILGLDVVQEAKNNLVVTAELEGGGLLNMHEPGTATVTPEGSHSVTYTLNKDRLVSKDKDGNSTAFVGNITWQVYRGATTRDKAKRASANHGDKKVVSATCTYNLSGEAVQRSLPPTQTGCEPGTTEEAFRTTATGKQCKLIRTCKPDRTWGDYQDDPNDPNCKEATPPTEPQESLVSFFQRVSKVPCDKEILTGARRRENAKEGCLEWGRCKLTVDNQRLFELDEETIAYVAAAKKKFDEANKEAKVKLSYNLESLTVANLVDAIMINPGVNGQANRVPKNTVCLLGKTIGGNARDPQSKQFDNMFGAFFAFFGYDAASFPSKWTTDCNTGQTVSNLRFRCGTNYWWGGYVNNGQRSGYKKEVDNGPWKGFPLAELLRGNFPTKNGIDLVQVNDEQSRITFHKIYADLEVKSPCRYPNGETMAQNKVLDYIQALCDNGEQIKPKAWKACPGNADPKRRGPQGKKDTRDCPDGNC